MKSEQFLRHNTFAFCLSLWKDTIHRLRIDNSRRSVIYNLYHMVGTMLLRITCGISNNRADLSLSYYTSDMFIRVELISKGI